MSNTKDKKEKHNLDTCTGDPCSCNPSIKYDWMESFDEKFVFGQSTEQGARIECEAKWIKKFIQSLLNRQREEVIKKAKNNLITKLKKSINILPRIAKENHEFIDTCDIWKLLTNFIK